jgi:hypothetical protein
LRTIFADEFTTAWMLRAKSTALATCMSHRGAQILTSKRGIGHRQTRTLNIIDDVRDFFETHNDGCALFKSPKHGSFEKFSCRHTFSSGSI